MRYKGGWRLRIVAMHGSFLVETFGNFSSTGIKFYNLENFIRFCKSFHEVESAIK